MKSNSGFTLVEVAMVIVVAAFIIGMSLQAVELIRMARVKATASQIKEIKSVTDMFWDKYNALPGDIQNPSNFLSNCAAAPCSTNGDNAVDANNRVSLNNNPADDPTGTEGERFFLHLRAADMYTKINPANGAVWGGFYPETPIRGNGITAGSYLVNPGAAFGGTIVDNTNLPLGLYLNIQGGTPAAPTAEIDADYVAAIDRALDDGTPDRGIMRGKTGGGASACEVAGPPITYAGDQGRCGFFIFLKDYRRDQP